VSTERSQATGESREELIARYLARGHSREDAERMADKVLRVQKALAEQKAAKGGQP
jgi:hypothetical protein